MNLLDKLKAFPTVHRDNCRACGNPWWFERAEDYQCTMCCATFPKVEVGEFNQGNHERWGKKK